MKDPATFSEVVAKSSQIRFDLNTNWHVRMNTLARVFSKITGEDRRIFYTLKDMYYYKGGYPRDTSPPRIEELLDKFIVVYRWYCFLGKEDEVSDYLSERGIKVSLETSDIKDEQLDIDSLISKGLKSKLLEILDVKNLPDKRKAFVSLLLDQGCELQGTICKLANEIKIDNFEVVKESCDVSKPNFITSVQLASKKLADEDGAKKDIKKKDHDADDLKEALVIIAKPASDEPRLVKT